MTSFSFSISGGVGVGSDHGGAVSERASKAKANPVEQTNANYLLSGLRSGAPGFWTDNRIEQSRHFLDIAYTAIHACCNAASSCEVHVTELMRSGKRNSERSLTRALGTSAPFKAHERQPVADAHPVADLLANPNPVDTTEDLLYELTLQRRLTGSGLLWQVPNDLKTARGYDATAEIYVLPTPSAAIMPRSVMYPNGAYRISPLNPNWAFGGLGSGAGAVLPAEQVTAIRYKHPYYKFDGYAPLTAGARLLDILEQIHRSWWSAHRKGINPSAVLESDPMKGAANLTPEEQMRIQARFDDRYASAENFGAIFVAPAGYSLKPYSNTPAEMAFGESWLMIVEAVLAIFGVPKAVIGWMENYSYAGLYAALKGFYLLSIRPDVQQVAAHLTKFLAWRYSRDLLIELELPSLDDPQLLEQQLANDDRAGIRTVDERRAVRKLPLHWDEEYGKSTVGYKDEQGRGGSASSTQLDDSSSNGDIAPSNLAGKGSKGTQRSAKTHGLGSRGIRRERDMEPAGRDLFRELTNGNGVHHGR